MNLAEPLEEFLQDNQQNENLPSSIHSKCSNENTKSSNTIGYWNKLKKQWKNFTKTKSREDLDSLEMYYLNIKTITITY